MPFPVSPSRREFLAASSVTLAGLTLRAPQTALALPVRARHPISTFFPDRIDPATLQSLAHAGVEAAQRAGATYSDIRVADIRGFFMTQYSMLLPFSGMQFDTVYGVRVQVCGAWGFAFGANPTVDAITRAAQSATATAKGLARLAGPPLEMAAAPAVHGEWTTPILIDPFSVPPNDHAQLLGAYKETAERVPDATMGRDVFNWTAETRVFASSEGSLLTQHLTRVRPETVVRVWPPNKTTTVLPVRSFVPACAGFECMLGSEIHDEIKETAEEAARLASYPEGAVDTGRYEAVLDGTALGILFGATLAQSLELDRVLGNEADGVGTSFLTPVENILGQPLFSSHLTATVDRAMPHYGAAKWDDEGVATEAFPLIQQGRVMDYFATRQSASVLATWYAKRGKPVASHGVATSWTPALSPTAYASYVALQADRANLSSETMVKDMTNGVLMRGMGFVSPDPQGAGGAFAPRMQYEVKRGHITRRLKGGTIQFNTKKLWNALTAVGGADTLENPLYPVYDDVQSETWTELAVTAPAAHFNQMDVTQAKRRF